MNTLWKVHTASVATFTGSTDTGDTYASAVDVAGLYDDGLMLVQRQGVEAVEGRAKFYADFEDAAKFVPESKVTVRGLVFQVERVHQGDAGGLFGPVSHVEVWLK